MAGATPWTRTGRGTGSRSPPRSWLLSRHGSPRPSGFRTSATPTRSCRHWNRHTASYPGTAWCHGSSAMVRNRAAGRRAVDPAVPCLGALVTAPDLQVRRGPPWPSVGAVMPVLILVTWSGTSLALALAVPNCVEWSRGQAGLELMSRAGEDAQRGIALLGTGWDPTSLDVWIAPEGWLVRLPLAAGFQPRSRQVRNAHGFANLCRLAEAGRLFRAPGLRG